MHGAVGPPADPILAQSALDRLAHNAYQIVIEGESYRSRQRPGHGNITARTPQPQSRFYAIAPPESQALDF